jgi:hypothetical protein
VVLVGEVCASRKLLLVGGDQAAEPRVEFARRLGFNLRSEASLIGASGDAAILLANLKSDGFVVTGEVMQFEIRVNLPEFFFDALLQDLEVAHVRSWKGLDAQAAVLVMKEFRFVFRD